MRCTRSCPQTSQFRVKVDLRNLRRENGTLGVEFNGTTEVVAVVPGDDLERHGVRIGDRVAAAGGVPTTNLDELLSAIRAVVKFRDTNYFELTFTRTVSSQYEYEVCNPLTYLVIR